MSAPDPFAPVSAEEASLAQSPAKFEKVPVLPVPGDAPPMNYKHPEYGRPVRVWEYRDESGALLGYDARFEWRDGDVLQKNVLPITYCSLGDGRHGWRQKALPAPRPLFGLDALAARPGAPVVVAEGAKSAAAAGELLPDYVAVSWQGGANACSKSSWLPLRGRDVLIWPDRDRHKDQMGNEKPYEDQPGTIAAQIIVAKIKDLAASVTMLNLEEFDCKDGWDADDALAQQWLPEQAAAFVEKYACPVDTDAPGTIMPYRFEFGEDGLYYVEDDKNRKRLCGRIKILAKTRDNDSGSWGLLLEWRDDDGRAHRWSMPKSMLAGDGSAIREHLLTNGLYVSTAASNRGKLLEFLSTVDTPLRARAVSAVGWAGAAFALPDLTIGDSAEDRIILQQVEAGAHHYGTSGSLEEWKEHVGRLAIGNSRLIFAMSAAMVGPILLPANEEGGGLNFVGSSSCGKTTAMKAAASIWGSHKFIRQWRATSNGLEGVAQQHNETLLCLDELSQVDPKEAGAIAYMLGNGQGKSRATRSGAGRAAAAWRVLFLSTGEVGLSEVMKEGRNSRRSMAGQEVRILDLPADAGAGMGLFEDIHGAASAEAFARQINTATATYYGTPSHEFLAYLTANSTAAGDFVAKVAGEFVSKVVPEGSDGQVQRAARRFGLVAAAGELAAKASVFPWGKGAAYRAASVMFKSWLNRRGGTGSAEVRNILKTVRLFLELHGNSRFEPWVTNDGETVRPVHNRAGFWKREYEGAESERKFYIFPTVFEEEICAGFDKSLVVKTLKAIGALKCDPQGKSTRKERLPGDSSTTRMYVVGPEIFDAGD